MYFGGIVSVGFVALAAGAKLPPRYGELRQARVNRTFGLGHWANVSITASADLPVNMVSQSEPVKTVFETVTVTPKTVYVTVGDGQASSFAAPNYPVCVIPVTASPSRKMTTLVQTSFLTQVRTVVECQRCSSSGKALEATPNPTKDGCPAKYPSQLPAQPEESSEAYVSPVMTEQTTVVTYSTDIVTIYSTVTDVVTLTLSDPPIPAALRSATAIPGGNLTESVQTSTSKEAIVQIPTQNNHTWKGWNSSVIAGSAAKEQSDLDSPEQQHGKGVLRAKRGTNVLNERQVGATVVATINGQVVSWINEWDGTMSRSSSSSAPSLPTSSVPSATVTPVPSHVSTNPSSTTAFAPSGTACGETGAFTLGFDDLPFYYPPDNDTASFPPIFNPYHHLYFSNGWSYGPPPTEPYPPSSGAHIGMYVPNDREDPDAPYAGAGKGGHFGAGPRASMDAYWFNVNSVRFGCDDGTTGTPCMVKVSGAMYSTENKTEIEAGSLTYSIPPCTDFKNCALEQLDFGKILRGLTSLKFSATVAGKPVMWFVDDIEMSWYNNTCAAGMERLRSR